MIKILEPQGCKVEGKGIVTFDENSITFEEYKKGSEEPDIQTITFEELKELFDGKEVKMNITSVVNTVKE